MLKEFKAFAIQGSLVDTAIAFVMGAAFGKITAAFIDGMIMPLISLITDADFSTWKTELKKAAIGADGKVIPAIEVKYGDFVSAIIYFLIVALVMFMIVKAIASAKKSAAAEEATAAPAPPPANEVLLGEIRDLLKSGR
jgi:large conductance mechanosensitive channel